MTGAVLARPPKEARMRDLRRLLDRPRGTGMRRSTALLVGVVAVLGFVTGCGGDDGDEAAPPRTERTGGGAAAPATFTTSVDGTDAYLGVVVGEESAIAYLCDGQEVAQWFSGAVAEDVVVLESATGGTVVATRSDGQLEGTVILPDQEVLSFSARPARGEGGLYREERTIDGVDYVAGWVKLDDEQVRGQVTITSDGTTTIASTDIQQLFPPQPLSTTKETDTPPLGGTSGTGTTTTTSTTRVPPAVTPLSDEECQKLREDKQRIEDQLAALKTIPTAALSPENKERISILTSALRVINFRLQGCS